MVDGPAAHAGRGLIRASDAIGLPVVSIADGEMMAEIQDVIYDPEQRLLIGFTLRRSGGLLSSRMTSVLPAERVGAIGADAVMVDNSDALTDPSDAPPGLAADQRRERDRSIEVLGTPAVTVEGRRLGTVAGVILDVRDAPRAVGYEVRETDGDGHYGPSTFVPISDRMALSADALVVPLDVLDFAGDDLSGFSRTLDEFTSGTPAGHRPPSSSPQPSPQEAP